MMHIGQSATAAIGFT